MKAPSVKPNVRRFVAGLPIALALAVGLFAASCDGERRGAVLQQVRERGVLRVATLNSPTTYFQGREGPAGFEHDLAHAYADHLGVDTQLVVRSTIADVFLALETGEADVAAAGLTITRARAGQSRFSRSYQSVVEQVVCRRGRDAPASLETLAAAEIVIAEGSAYAGTLRRLAQAGFEPRWRVEPGANVEQLLSHVSNGTVGCTIADSTVVALHQRYMPNLRVALELPDRQQIGWVFAGGLSWRSVSLKRSVDTWLRRRGTREYIADLNEAYYGFAPENTEAAEAGAFRAAVDKTLPTYKSLFVAEAERAGVPWTLLAAVAYQESHWNPDAKSPTGVRGLLMLTLPTAKALGVSNRLDATQSTRGGAKYLRQLRDRLPEEIPEQDRWWFAAAAYNMGWGHVIDVRELAERNGLDPNSWAQVRELLPLLEDPEIYKTLGYGYGNGRQAQTYVRRIRDYADVLEKKYAAPIPDTPSRFAQSETGDADATLEAEPDG